MYLIDLSGYLLPYLLLLVVPRVRDAKKLVKLSVIIVKMLRDCDDTGKSSLKQYFNIVVEKF